MTEHTPDPSLPVPNDDPRCHCALVPGEMPEDAIRPEDIWPPLEGAGLLLAAGQEFTVDLHADCPHHGSAARQVLGA